MKKAFWIFGLMLLIAAIVGGVWAQGSGRAAITTANAATLVELMRIGRGTTDHVAFSPDGGTIAVASSVGIWLYPAGDLGTQAEPPLLKTPKVAAALAYSPDGSMLAVAVDSDVQIWDTAGQTMIASFRPPRSCSMLTFSPDGRTLALNLTGGGLVLWDMVSGAQSAAYQGMIQTDGALVYSADGTRIAGATSDNTVHVWNAADLTEIAQLKNHTRYVYDFAFSPDGAVLVSASYDKTVRLWDVASATELAVLQGTESQPVDAAYSLAASPDGSILASGHAAGLVVIWDVNTFAPARVFGPGSGNIVDLAFSSDGSKIVTVSSEAAVKLWDVATGNELAAALDHTPTMLGAVFSPDSSTLTIAETNKNLWFWDTATMPALHQMTPLPNVTYSGQRVETMLAYTSDGKYLATTDGFDVILVDAVSKAEVKRFKDCVGTTASFAFSPDNLLLAEAASGGLCVYDLEAGTLLANFPSGDWLNSVAFSPDQALIAVASKDHTVRVYGLP
jgi:WD40 repeat protein